MFPSPNNTFYVHVICILCLSKGIHDRQKMSDEAGEGDGNGRHLNIYLPINLFMKQPACTEIMQQVK